MCASSKVLHSAWMQLLKQQPSPAWLLPAVAEAAQAKTTKLLTKATAVVRWLLSSLPEARLAEHPSIPAGLVAIPHMSRSLAKLLCESGVRVPYSEIVAAARQRVEGVEVWVTVQSSLGLAGDIPPIIDALFTKDHLFCPVDDADLHGLLYLSLNSTSKTAPKML
uniref:Uncharacterized protein n=1 Tax=Tetradesmus obliquus TaxID=3088 RepID=A0A383VE74_TETOB|eukprot:jgi/Sobl393_1/15304/SZX63032.1